mmetsp:Transcript_12240/g.38787  ORF Transcript_12240/g.38787 Transcript_12240/m.38787 type:complete len:200 (+) Transcript_12240:1170-1769(+)
MIRTTAWAPTSQTASDVSDGAARIVMRVPVRTPRTTRTLTSMSPSGAACRRYRSIEATTCASSMVKLCMSWEEGTGSGMGRTSDTMRPPVSGSTHDRRTTIRPTAVLRVSERPSGKSETSSNRINTAIWPSVLSSSGTNRYSRCCSWHARDTMSLYRGSKKCNCIDDPSAIVALNKKEDRTLTSLIKRRLSKEKGIRYE